MAVFLCLKTGDYGESTLNKPISNDLFGVRYISYRNVDRFLDQIDDANIGLIVWPGGTLAETREDRFGFEFEGLYSPVTNKPGISEMMSIAIEKDVSLSVILPTARYANSLSTLETEINGFLVKLLDGDFGPLPGQLTFEIGSEYFSNFDIGAASAAAQYGAVAEVMITEIALAFADPSLNKIGADVTIAIQAGKTFADDQEIREALSQFSIENVDSLIHHRFAYKPEGIDSRMDTLELVLDAWEDELGDVPNLFVSSWNTVTLTRNNVLEDYVIYESSNGRIVDPVTIDLDGRTNTDFEEFWQATLEKAAYGQEHAVYILEGFSSYAEAGADAASLYGVDLIHPGRISWSQGGESFDFVGAEMLEMIYESVGGTHLLESPEQYDPENPVTTYAFENKDKLIVFLAAGATAPGDVTLGMDGLGVSYHQLWAERLTGATPDNWMELFGVTDNPDVDESAEAETYALGIRDQVAPEIGLDSITVALESPHEIIRLAFAKTAAGGTEIAGWTQGKATDLQEVVDPPSVPTDCGLTDDENEEDSPSLALLAETAGSIAGLGLILAIMLLL